MNAEHVCNDRCHGDMHWHLPINLTVDFDEWWANQVRKVLPRWVNGTHRNGYQDGLAWWPLEPNVLEERLTHLAEMTAHS